jgi:hypothetical protein
MQRIGIDGSAFYHSSCFHFLASIALYFRPSGNSADLDFVTASHQLAPKVSFYRPSSHDVEPNMTRSNADSTGSPTTRRLGE